MAYAYGLPNWLVALVHILIGSGLVYVGWELNQGRSVNQQIAVTMIVLGALAALYHTHLWYLRRNEL